MKENDVIKKAKNLFYCVEIIPEATPAEKEYNKNIFALKGRPEEYRNFFNKCLVKRYEIYFNSYSLEYCDPVTIYTISQLQALVYIREEINKAEDLCQWDRADNLYIKEEDFIKSITAPDAYQAANISA